MPFEGGERLKSGRLVEMSVLKNTGKHISKIRGNEGLMVKLGIFLEWKEQDR